MNLVNKSIVFFIFIYICKSHANLESSELETYKNIVNREILKDIGEYLVEKNDLNLTDCERDIAIWYANFESDELWARQMLDSWGQIPPGLLTLNIHSYGQFDECVNIDKLRIKGKYCLAKFPIDLLKNSKLKQIMEIKSNIPEHNGNMARLINFDEFGQLSYINAICFPHTCKTSEIKYLIEIVLDIDKSFTIPDKDCVMKDSQIWTSTDFGAIFFFVFFGFLMVLSTIYDVFTKFINKDNRSNHHDLLISFSIWTNTSKLTSINRSPKSIRCLHGLRAISILWVILGHRYSVSIIIPITNSVDIFDWLQKAGSMVVLAGTAAVDTFFVLSGLLVAYISFKQFKRREIFNIPLFYLHRFLRLTPALAAVIFFQVSLYKFLGDGPLWNKFSQDMIDRCVDHWWSTILYVQNYVNPDKMCIPQTWYLSCDMHLYILSPIVILPFLRWKRVGWINIAFWILLSQIGVFVLAFVNEWSGATSPLAGGDENRDKRFYYASHARATPWLMGFAAGYLLHITSGTKIKIHKAIVAACWLISFATMAAVIFGMTPLQQYDHEISHGEDTMYNTFAKTAWAASIIWIILACTYGYGGPVNWFLSLDLWEIIGKLSYCMYLVHISAQYLQSGRTRNATYFSDFSTMMAYLTDVALTIMIAYLLAISFELPFAALEKILFTKKKPSTEMKRNNSIPPNIEAPSNLT